MIEEHVYHSMQSFLALLRELYKIVAYQNHANKKSIQSLLDYLQITEQDYQILLGYNRFNFSDNRIQTYIGKIIPKLLAGGISKELLTDFEIIDDTMDWHSLLFTMDDDLAEKLDEYLDSLKQYGFNQEMKYSDMTDISKRKMKEKTVSNLDRKKTVEEKEEDRISREEFRASIKANYMTIKKKDGTPFYNDVVKLYHYINGSSTDESVRDFVASSKANIMTKPFLQKDVKNQIIDDYKSFAQKNNIPIEQKPILTHGSEKEKTIKLDNDALSKRAINLLLIRETIYVLCDMDDIDYELFYQYINDNEEEYDQKLLTNMSCKNIADILEPFGFSKKLFSATAPILLPMSKSVKKIIYDSGNPSNENFDIVLFAKQYYDNMVYNIEEENAPLVYSCYKLLEQIKKQ